MERPSGMTASFVTIEGRVLAKALKLICAVVEKRTTHPILTTVKLSVSGSTLTAIGTALDVEAISILDVIDAHGEWSACVDARMVERIARMAGPAELRLAPFLQGDGDPYLSVSTSDASYELQGHTVDAFPSIGGNRAAEIERFGNGSLATMLAKVSWCISTEETRYYLNGVCWQHGPKGRRLVTTDGHRLALCTYAADTVPDPIHHIIPRKTAKLLQAFTAGQDVVIYATDKTYLEFVFGNTTLRSKVIEGTFPDVDRVVPKGDSAKFRLSVPVGAGIAAIDQALIGGNDRGGRALRIHRTDDGRVGIECRNHGEGFRATTAWPCDFPDDAPEFGLNGPYLHDILTHCTGTATFHGIDAKSPFRITDDDETMLRVQMPMRV